MNNYLTLKDDRKFSNFVITLDEPIVLKGAYEVGLCEIFFPIDYNVSYGELLFSIPAYLIDSDHHFETFEQEKTFVENCAKRLTSYYSETKDAFIEKLESYFNIKDKTDRNILCDQILVELDHHFDSFLSVVAEILKCIATFTLYYPEVESLHELCNFKSILAEYAQSSTTR